MIFLGARLRKVLTFAQIFIGCKEHCFYILGGGKLLLWGV